VLVFESLELLLILLEEVLEAGGAQGTRKRARH
jgi:hypothetical protein